MPIVVGSSVAHRIVCVGFASSLAENIVDRNLGVLGELELSKEINFLFRKYLKNIFIVKQHTNLSNDLFTDEKRASSVYVNAYF